MATPDRDCLFVHVPKADNHYLPLGDFFNITYMPMGVPALAELLHRNGRKTEVIHLGVEQLNDNDFNLIDDLDGQSIRAIGLPLYWHYQSYDVIETARALKAAHPEAFIFLGGITAGYFASEIVRDFPCVDGVMKGHVEGGCLSLIDTLESGGDLGKVANLVHRDNSGKVYDNTTNTALKLAPVPLERFARVIPVDGMDDLLTYLEPIGEYLQCAAVDGTDDSERRVLASVGVSRLCPPGRMGTPTMVWRHDGVGCLEALVRGCDEESAEPA